MNAKTKPPIGVAAIVLLIGLATMGMGYGLWSKVLTIDTTVQTGSVDGRWVFASCDEFYTWPDLPTPNQLTEFLGKDVGSFELDLDGDQLFVTLHNTYPSYAVICDVKFKVEGTIPVILRGVDITPVSPNLAPCELSKTEDEQNTTLECPELTVIYIDGIGSQVHPGSLVASDLLIHVEQPAAQGDTYQFELGVCFAQWNEAASSELCFQEAD